MIAITVKDENKIGRCKPAYSELFVYLAETIGLLSENINNVILNIYGKWINLEDRTKDMLWKTVLSQKNMLYRQ